MRTNLLCNQCQFEFEGLVRFVSIEPVDRGTLGWIPDTGGVRGNTCPQCGSEAIKVVKPTVRPDA